MSGKTGRKGMEKIIQEIHEKLKEIEITKKDYIDYVEAIKQNATNRYREQGSVPVAHETGKAQGIG